MNGIRYARIFWIGAAAVLVLAALIAISALLRGDFTDEDGQVLLTMLALLVSSGTAVAGLTLAERGLATVGWGAAILAVVSFLLITATTWEGFDNEPLAKAAATATLALVATLLATTQLVLHRGEHLWLVIVTGLGLLLGLVTTSVGIWDETSSDALWKVAGSCWIVGAVGWLLLPVLQRFTAAGVPAAVGTRVLASLEDVELVATRTGGIEVHLEAGERLALRRRP